MKFLIAVLAGIAGTAAMSAFLYLLSYATHRVMKAIKILGTMLLFRTQPNGSLSDAVSTKAVGTVAHYAVGVFFATMYLALWDSGVGALTASWALLFGVGHSIIGMFAWYLFFMVHPKPPLIKLKTYLVTLIFAHILFGFVTTYTFYLFTQPAYSFWQ
ncbi:hypothetical protein CLV24_101286 [Pontibacter ummariensis]|uniref:DUF2938 domain-containing protein n=1 Tax=Pontibacter ummariensis TaxID=1610492 RepID=A0A239BB64_9BACT|nr:hypothetical protein [Pontibacter ummariensis]PRY16440.1 hypothetical protein CLV24_101286 [Pontibacter ummariensis]SNS05187.1 hypothetical protein SAMN06296052_101286 [Pontibacter ummariensis]